MITKYARHASLSALVVVIALVTTVSIAATENKIPYQPDFVRLVEQGKISNAEIISEPSGATYIRATITGTEEKDKKTVKVDVLPADPFATLLKEKGIPFSFKRQQSLFYKCTSILPAIAMFLIWILWITVIIAVFWLAFRLVRAVERIAENTKK
jgi:hypothetical protein